MATNTPSIPYSTATQSTAASNEHEIIACLNAVLEGNYRMRLSNDSPLNHVINQLIDKLETDTIAVMDRTVQLSMNASETTIDSARMLSSLREMDTRSQSIATGAEQMEVSIENINRYGSEITQEVSETEETVSHSALAAAKTIETMNAITQSVDETLNKVQALEKFSGEIADVAETIKGIAFQTNLLSLNANVEAAKAGDAGRGFAVVAKEVGILARRSGEATKAIDEMVKNTQQEIKDIIGSMERSSRAVNQGQTAIQSLDASMIQVQEKVTNVRASATQISHTLEEQNQAVSMVSSGIHEIADATASSVQGIESIVVSMQQIEKVVEKALASVGQKEVHNKVLKLAQSDHVAWKKRLINIIVGLENMSSHELADHHSCRLGKWYNQVQDHTLKNDEAFVYLEGPHREVHECGKRAIDLYNRGAFDEALAEIQKVETASEEVLDILVYLDEKNR